MKIECNTEIKQINLASLKYASSNDDLLINHKEWRSYKQDVWRILCNSEHFVGSGEIGP